MEKEKEKEKEIDGSLSAARSPCNPGRVPKRLLLVGLAGAVALGGSYVVLAGNPLTRNQQPVTYPTSAVKRGTVQVTVSATGPVTVPVSVPLSFPNSGNMSEVDGTVGRTVTAGQVLAKLDTTALQIAVSGGVHCGRQDGPPVGRVSRYT